MLVVDLPDIYLPDQLENLFGTKDSDQGNLNHTNYDSTVRLSCCIKLI